MSLVSLAARSLLLSLRQGGAAILPRAVAAHRLCVHGMASSAAPDVGADKKRVREEVKKALRQLSAEQMAEESE